MLETATLMEEDRLCPVCGKKMTQKFHEYWVIGGRVRTFYWWCACGHTEEEEKP